MEAKLQAVIQEFNVSRFMILGISLLSLTWAITCQLTTLMRAEMKLDVVKELAGRMISRMSELQAKIDVALQDNSGKPS
jgi:hypothetical protein